MKRKIRVTYCPGDILGLVGATGTVTEIISIDDTTENYRTLLGNDKILDWQFLDKTPEEESTRDEKKNLADIYQVFKDNTEIFNPKDMKDLVMWIEDFNQEALATGRTLVEMFNPDGVEKVFKTWKMKKRDGVRGHYSFELLRDILRKMAIPNFPLEGFISDFSSTVKGIGEVRGLDSGSLLGMIFSTR